MSSDNEELLMGDYETQHPDALNQQYVEDELNRKFPNRPVNHKSTLPFHTLYQDLFDPLTNNLKRKAPTGPTGRQAGPKNVASTNPKEVRRGIIERFFSRWRREVGDDIFPAMRLIIPEKDKERAVYGLKEKALARYLVKLMKIDRNSDDAFNLLNWKLPGQNATARNAGDFAGRCYEVLCKRAHLIEPGNMTIDEVNEHLNELAKDAKQETQLPVMEIFYKSMNADELTWLIRIITRGMRIGATEKTIFEVWHPDAEALFNISSNLRRVCWELYDPMIRLEGNDRGVKLWECYQPQLAYQPNKSFQQMVASMRPTEEDPEFWIEEKLDGERMQLHVSSDPESGKKKFKFWSRQAKDYTYLYGKSFEDKSGALMQYVPNVFKDGVENAILDGEMITWNIEQDTIAPFGTLKPAAIANQTNPQNRERPLYRVFDILLLNNQALTRYTLRDRRKALEATINNMHRRMEILPYTIGIKVEDVERSLRAVVARASEGLVVKNPRSAYILNARILDWVKVKPEYMTEFGESLDCLIVGGYYGSGRRGGELSSFLCGLREDKPDGRKTTRFLSFFKFGGGMTTEDFKKLRHNTEGKWYKYDAANPPSEYIELGGPIHQAEKPDMWIKPEDSLVVEVKAASVNSSEDYAMRVTLRFPRFTKFRLDRNWESALSVEEFQNVKAKAEEKVEENKKEAKQIRMSKRKQKTQATSRKKQVIIAGYEDEDAKRAEYHNAKSNVFNGLAFYIITESTKPEKKTKLELEEMVKANGGKIVQSAEIKTATQEEPEAEIVCVAERRTVKVASVEKRGRKTIVKPIWLFDCIRQGKIDFARGLPEMVVPFETDRHLFFAVDDRKAAYEGHVDQYGDSYARDTTKEELKQLMDGVESLVVNYDGLEKGDLLEANDCRGWMFADLVFWFDDGDHASNGNDVKPASIITTTESQRLSAAKTTARFAGASIVTDFNVKTVTHVILTSKSDKRSIRQEISLRKRLPRIVSLDWVEECWNEHTRIDEERFAVV